MSELIFNNQSIAVDAEGYLVHLHDWTPEIAHYIALSEGITLTPAHWEVIHLLRDFYDTFNLSPAMRPLVKYAKQKLGPEKSNSIYLMQLFPQSPPKLGAKIAGLPRPANCL